MEVRNLTPHPVNLVSPSGETTTLPPEGIAPRAKMLEAQRGEVEVSGVKVPLVESRIGQVADLPPQRPNTLLIVSSIVAQASHRDDLVVPTRPIRDEEGRIVGAGALAHLYSPIPRVVALLAEALSHLRSRLGEDAPEVEMLTEALDLLNARYS